MSSLETTKKIMKDMGSDNFLKLVANVLFNDISHIKVFKSNETYYANDIVFITSDISGEDRDNLYVCVKDVVTEVYNPTDWKVLTLRPSNRNRYLLKSERFTASKDSTMNIDLGMYISAEKHLLSVVHSVRGRLIEGVHWNITGENKNILTLKDTGMFSGEWLHIDFYE